MTSDFVYGDFVIEDFVIDVPASNCDFVVEDFVNDDFTVCVTPTTEEPSRTGGIGGFVSRYNVTGYRGRPLAPFEVRYPKPKPKHIIIETEPEKITDVLGKKIEELVITKPEPIPVYIDFIPVRKTIQTVKLAEEPKPLKPEEPKIDFARIKRLEKERLRKAALKKKLEELKTLLHLTFIEHYI